MQRESVWKVSAPGKRERSFIWLLVSWIWATESLVCKAEHVREMQSFQGVRVWVVRGSFQGPSGKLGFGGETHFLSSVNILSWTTGSPASFPHQLYELGVSALASSYVRRHWYLLPRLLGWRQEGLNRVMYRGQSTALIKPVYQMKCNNVRFGLPLTFISFFKKQNLALKPSLYRNLELCCFRLPRSWVYHS